MLTTPQHHLPYPDDDEWLEMGAYSIEQLATRLDAILASTDAVTVARAEHTGTAGGVVQFPGDASLSNFTESGGVYTFTGPSARLFVIAAEVEVEAGGNVPSVESVVEVQVDGSGVAGSHDQLSLASGSVQVRRYTHTVTVPVLLAPSQTVQVIATSTPAGGALGVCGLRIYPIGPRQ